MSNRVLYIELSCCIDCPYLASSYEVFHDPKIDEYHCMNATAGNAPVIHINNGIPESCPLPTPVAKGFKEE